MTGGGNPPESPKQRALALQESILSRPANLLDAQGQTISTAKRLFNEIRSILNGVTILEADNRLDNSMDEIFALLRMMPPEAALKESTQRKLSNIPVQGARYVLLGGGNPRSTNFDRSSEVPHFRRVDGAWFEFRLIVEEVGRNAPLQVLTYGFEIRFPGTAPGWVRFDLNLPGHDNVDDGLRAHFHPGTEDWSVPSPVLSPWEALDQMLWHTCVRPGRKNRT